MMKRYAICGLGNRAIEHYILPLTSIYSTVGSVVGLLDPDPLRFEICRARVPAMEKTPTFDDQAFGAMVAETKPDTVMVLGWDDTHAGYIVQALKEGLDVIVEKPMATTIADCHRVLAAEAAAEKASVAVTFNMRYAPEHRKIKEMLIEGAVGRVTSVDLNWYVDTRHGASYFRRWHRERERSGGLSVHKGCHHFDLLNWWIDQIPEEVFAYGALNYFGANGEMNPRKADGRHCMTCTDRYTCAYRRRWANRGDLITETAPQYYTIQSRDRCCFDSIIAVEDTYAAVIRYDRGTVVNYSANFSAPYGGYRLAINGTRGRIETQRLGLEPVPVPDQTIEYFPLFHGAKETISLRKSEGGHGGGDPAILEDLFLGPDPARPYEILAGAREGALAVAVGEAVWRSCKSGKPERISDPACAF